ncbi:MAG: CtsR family transcriptional regulator [Firmicutes bacterium]|jgi:transcriptional regulator CtsR|nr:CtsR family transcriptional regulator [Bacillota bacterium]
MSNLADHIETYIKRLLAASPNATLILQRKELAERFRCVPSQINYVLSTRFTTERGYLVESRRGGGGYLKIRRLDLNRTKVMQLLSRLNELSQGITKDEAFDFITRLTDDRLITHRESRLMKAILAEEFLQTAEVPAKILVRMLEVILEDA